MDEASILVVQTPLAPADEAALGTEVALAKPQMSPDEWYARFRAMFEARKFSDEQWKLLSSVQVADDEAIVELQREMVRNRPEAVVRQVTLDARGCVRDRCECRGRADADRGRAGSRTAPLSDRYSRKAQFRIFGGRLSASG